MKTEKKNFEQKLLDDPCSIASTTECTGLIQIPPTNENEAEAYSEIYVIPEQVYKVKKEGKSPKQG